MKTAPALGALSLALVAATALAQSPADMPENSWLALPNTKLDAVQADPGMYAALQGNGFYTIVDAWNGAVLDTKRMRLVIWGGGHNDYYGNEMYAFDIATSGWSRLTDPTEDWTDCGDPNPDGTANSRHTYNGMAYLEHADRFWVSGGALNCTSGSCGADITWTFDFDTASWQNMQPAGSHTTGCENNAAYDPASQRVYFGDQAGLYSYSYDDNAWTKHNDDNLYAMTSTVDTKRGLLVLAGSGNVYAYAIGAGDFSQQVWSTTGGDALVAKSSPGLAYDPTTDRVVGWAGGPVYVLDPETKQFTSYDPPGAPAAPEQGMFGRFRYVPTVNAFIAVTATDEDVHFYKLSAGGTLPPPNPGGAGGSAGSGGGGGGSGGSGGSSGGSATASSNDDGGCGCRTARSDGAMAWVLLGLLALARRRPAVN
jgi:MYXO-CTERM domain-containing protein